MSGINVLHLIGLLPNMLELTINPCLQGCDYCYAKRWPSEYMTVDQVLNDILKKENNKNTLTGFLIKHRSPITISNRSDIMCLSNWKDYIKPIKQLGFPIYLETKLNKDYQNIPNYFNKNEDQIYITITGYGRKYEEKAFLSGDERIEAAKWLIDAGFNVCIGFNPYLPDKITIDDIKKIIKYCNPSSVVMRPYHTTSQKRDLKYFMKEWPEKLNNNSQLEIIKYCEQNNIKYDINLMIDIINTSPHLNDVIYSNNKFFGGNHFIYHELVYKAFGDFNNPEYEIGYIMYDEMLEIFKKQIDYFSKAIINKAEVASRSDQFIGFSAKFGILDYLHYTWNHTKRLLSFMDEFTDMRDKNNNKIYGRFRDDLIKI